MNPAWGDEYQAILPHIESAIKEAAFIAIDCEFTGLKDHRLQLPKPQGRKQTIQERYQDVICQKNAGFALIQLGVCPVSWDPDAGNYVAKPFNFFVSPVLDPIFGLDRTFLCQSSAMEMLCHEGMDFNYLLRHGIRYLSRDEDREVRAREADLTDGIREPIMIDAGGEKFLVNVKSQIQSWINDTSEGRYDFCNISVTSSYYKRILHQSLPKMFPKLIIRSSKKDFIQIVENKESTRNALKSMRKQKFESRIEEAIGLRKVVEMISQSQCTLVGHNLFQDLIFIWSQLIGKLPDTVESFCQSVSDMFPTIYDTKYISAAQLACCDLKIPEALSIVALPPTGLENLAFWARQLNVDSRLRLLLHHKHIRYGVHEQQHEAGYDAYLTAQVFLALAAERVRHGKVLDVQTDLVSSVDKRKIDFGTNVESIIGSFKEGIFEEWKGILSVNGTLEGSIKLVKKTTASLAA